MTTTKSKYAPGDTVIIRENPHDSKAVNVTARVVSVERGFGGQPIPCVQAPGWPEPLPIGEPGLEPAEPGRLWALAAELEARAREYRDLATEILTSGVSPAARAGEV